MMVYVLCSIFNLEISFAKCNTRNEKLFISMIFLYIRLVSNQKCKSNLDRFEYHSEHYVTSLEKEIQLHRYIFHWNSCRSNKMSRIFEHKWWIFGLLSNAHCFLCNWIGFRVRISQLFTDLESKPFIMLYAVCIIKKKSKGVLRVICTWVINQ